MKRGLTAVVLPLLGLLLILIVGCTPGIPRVEDSDDVTLSNPAADLCLRNGHQYQIRTQSDGSQYGVCRFTNGRECDAWAYFRGDCDPDDMPLEEVPADVVLVRNSAIRHINQQFAVEIPETGWRIQAYPTASSEIGYRFIQETCLMLIHREQAREQYRVELDEPRLGLHWAGRLDRHGKLLPEEELIQDVSQPDPESVEAVINLVELEELYDTSVIEINRLLNGNYMLVMSITDAGEVRKLVVALDHQIPLVCAQRCPTLYQVVFIKADGTRVTFDMICPPNGSGNGWRRASGPHTAGDFFAPSVSWSEERICGETGYWEGYEGVLPETFVDALLPLLKQFETP